MHCITNWPGHIFPFSVIVSVIFCFPSIHSKSSKIFNLNHILNKCIAWTTKYSKSTAIKCVIYVFFFFQFCSLQIISSNISFIYFVKLFIVTQSEIIIMKSSSIEIDHFIHLLDNIGRRPAGKNFAQQKVKRCHKLAKANPN